MKVSKFKIIGDVPEEVQTVFIYTDLNMWEIADKCILRETALVNEGKVNYNRRDKRGIVVRTKEDLDNLEERLRSWKEADLTVSLELQGDGFLHLPKGYGIYGVGIMPKEEHKIMLGLYDLSDPENNAKTVWYFPE